MSDAAVSRAKTDLQRAGRLHEFVVQEAIKFVDAARDERLIELLRWTVKRHAQKVCPSDFGGTCREQVQGKPHYAEFITTHPTWAQLTTDNLAKMQPRYGIRLAVDIERVVRAHLGAP